MTRHRGLIDLAPDRQELLRALSRGASPEDVGWALELPAEDVTARALEAMDELAGDLDPLPPGAERRKVGDYLLRRQSPGVAAGTWELLEHSPAALAYATELRKALTGLGEVAPPELPADGATFAYARRSDLPAQGAGLELAGRRRERSRQRTRHQVQQAAAIAVSPYREEAINAYRDDESDIKLPHYASRPTRLALYALIALLVLGLLMASLVEVPVYTSAKVLVVDVPESAPSQQQGLSIVGLFPTQAKGELKVGQTLRVQLPDTTERVSTRISFVSDEVLSPEEVRQRFGLPDPSARRVRGPAAVVVADLRTPEGAPDRSTFDGAITEQAEVKTGSERILSLVF